MNRFEIIITLFVYMVAKYFKVFLSQHSLPHFFTKVYSLHEILAWAPYWKYKFGVFNIFESVKLRYQALLEMINILDVFKKERGKI